MPADFEVFVQCSVTPLHMSERAAAPQIVRRFELIKKRVRFFCLLFLFILSPSSQLWYNAADSSKKYNTDETETQKLFISWRCRGNFSVMIKFRQLLTLLTTNTVVLRMTGGLVGGNQTSNFFPESSRCAGQRSVLLLSCDSRDQSIWCCCCLLLFIPLWIHVLTASAQTLEEEAESGSAHFYFCY